MTVAQLIEKLSLMPAQDRVYFEQETHDQPVTTVTMHRSKHGVILR
jgi:hypothetical protein